MRDQGLVRSCLSCGGTEEDKPLIYLSYRQAPLAICPQCLPTLIHQPERLTGTLADLQRGDSPGNQQ